MRQTRGLGYRAKRAERSDMMWGGVLAIGIPIVVLFIYNIVDPHDAGDQSIKMGAGQQTMKKSPPMSTAHAASVVAQLDRLHKENFQTILRPIMEMEELKSQERVNAFNCLNKVYNRCLQLLNKLEKDLERRDTQISSFKPKVQQWSQVLNQVGQEVKRLDPMKGFR